MGVSAGRIVCIIGQSALLATPISPSKHHIVPVPRSRQATRAQRHLRSTANIASFSFIFTPYSALLLWFDHETLIVAITIMHFIQGSMNRHVHLVHSVTHFRLSHGRICCHHHTIIICIRQSPQNIRSNWTAENGLLYASARKALFPEHMLFRHDLNL